MTTGINESKKLTKHISCKCKCKFDGTKCKSNQWWNHDKFGCECKKYICEKDYAQNPGTRSCENGMYLASIMDDSTIISDEVKESYDEKLKAIPTNFNGKKVTCQAQNFYILLAFLLTTIALLIPVSIYCYLIKYRVKNLSPFHNTSNKLNKFCINSIN